MDREEIIRMAREALESKYIVNCGAWRVQQNQAITVLRQALVDADDISQKRVDGNAKREHEWVGLTDEEVDRKWAQEMAAAVRARGKQ